ncbi:hypothetical protein JAAARDRAFT_421508 [Jaapia argillacea MUCL 33604]|uniref:Uncharacterized protein n=1 Tax=Jaapia argillacea MUCL 33604 TaxID=933084 RepID=A0A067PFN3_9AGAM|nr:hypothetical protein JAAARDRAFT_421508 [Jaapia argillacea MUCL 33604]
MFTRSECGANDSNNEVCGTLQTPAHEILCDYQTLAIGMLYISLLGLQNTRNLCRAYRHLPILNRTRKSLIFAGRLPLHRDAMKLDRLSSRFILIHCRIYPFSQPHSVLYYQPTLGVSMTSFHTETPAIHTRDVQAYDKRCGNDELLIGCS